MWITYAFVFAAFFLGFQIGSVFSRNLNLYAFSFMLNNKDEFEDVLESIKDIETEKKQ